MKSLICLLDLNYTLVSNQLETRTLRPFTRRMEAEEYRSDLINAVKDDYVIIVTARPERQMNQTMSNILAKTGWKSDEAYFNNIEAEPPIFKEYILNNFIFPKYGMNPEQFYAVESNPRTRAMYSRYGIKSASYEKFIKTAANLDKTKKQQISFFDI